MNIAIDARSFLYTRTGIGYSIIQILKRFFEYHGEHEYILYGTRKLGRNLVNTCQKLEINALDHIQPVPFPFRKLSRYYLEITSSVAIKNAGVQLFWGPNYRGIFSRRFDTVITIHDMAHIHYPDFAERHGYSFLKDELRGHAERSALILTDSISTKKDIINYLGISEDKIRVVYLGVDPYFRPIQDEDKIKEIRNRYGLLENIILFVGTLQPRKNIEGLIEAFRILNEEWRLPHQLVMVGCKGWQYSEVFRRIEAYGLKEKVKWAGYVDYKDLPVLYSMADVLVLPSYYEGFSLPILEAMACGTPVITSNVSSMPEVAGDAAILIDPKSPEMIAENIYRILTDSEVSRRLREKGFLRTREFSWERCATEILKSFEEVAKGKQ